MEHASRFSRALSADEVTELAPPPDADAENTTTSLVDSRSQSTAEAHFPGSATSTRSADDSHPNPDPAPIMPGRARPPRALSADEIAELAPPSDAVAESPTTSLVNLKTQSTAEAHFPGIASSERSVGAHDTDPDPAPIKEH